MSQTILDLAQKFISIPSTADNPKALGDILDLSLSPLKGHTIERFEHNGIKSALVYNTTTRPKKFKIIFNGHLDVIPGKIDQYTPYIKGNRLYGAGSMDMKANAACLIEVFTRMAREVKYPLALQLVTDEEIGGMNGTKYHIDQGVRADFVISGEPTDFDIVHKAKGILWLNISASGKSAHGAYPWRGENAIWKMHEFLTVLKKKYPIPDKEQWITTVNLSQITTNNSALNKIPDDCMVQLDIRYIPEDADVLLKDIRKLLPKGFEIEIITNEPALHTDSNNNYIKLLKKSCKPSIKKTISLRGANGTSDARHFARVGGAGVEFGPIGAGIGSDHEWVDIKSLETYVQILTRFLQSCS